MITYAIAFFSLAAIIGMVMLSFVLQDKKPTRLLVFTHGPLAIAAIILLLVYSGRHHPIPFESIVLFLIAATGGIILVMHDLLGKPIPKWLGIAHGLIAVAGFIFLLIFQFS
jgi:hypothetical protein